MQAVSLNKSTLAPQRRGQPGELKQGHTSPATQRVDLGHWVKCTQAPWHRVSLGGWGKPMQVSAMQKDPHKHLPSKFQPAVQGGTEKQAPAMIPGTSRELVALQLCWEGHFEAAAEIDAPKRNTAKARTKPKGILNPWTLQNLLLDSALSFRDRRSSSINQNTATSSTNQENIIGH